MTNSITLDNGTTIWWEDNSAGGRAYYTDEVGDGVMIFDTCITRLETVEAALEQERKLRAMENLGDQS